MLTIAKLNIYVESSVSQIFNVYFDVLEINSVKVVLIIFIHINKVHDLQ